MQILTYLYLIFFKFLVINRDKELVHSLNSRSSVLECCKSDNNTIRECLFEYYYLNHLSYNENQISDIQNLMSKYLVITYSTDNILDYSLYSFAINSAYVQFQNFLTHPKNDLKIFSTSSKSGFEFEPRDQRWNKVYILRQLLIQLMTSDVQYLIWMDSDLVVINFQLNIQEDLLKTHPNADMIISQEAYPENGMVNTGCMIVRKTQWSISFLTDWWLEVDRVSAMDQHVFDLVYNNRKSKAINKTDDIDVHIVILGVDEINSYIPAMKYQKPENKILHLAGESSIIRKKTFQTGFQTICNAAVSSYNDTTHNNSSNLKMNLSSHNYLPVQLGLTQQWLRQFDYHNTLRSELIVILRKMYICSPDSDIAAVHIVLTTDETLTTTSTCSLVEIITLQNELRDTMQSRSRITILSDRINNNNSNSNITNNNREESEQLQYTQITYLYILGLKWIFHYYFKTYQQQVAFANNNNNDNKETSSSLQAELTQLQYVIDAAFDLCVVDIELDDDNVLLFSTLQLIKPMIDHIIFNTNEGFIHISSKGAALYYKFKYLEMLARYFYRNNNKQQYPLQSLQYTLQVVEEAIQLWYLITETYHYYGPGNNHAAIAHTCNSRKNNEINDLILLKQQLIDTIILKDIEEVLNTSVATSIIEDNNKRGEMIDYDTTTLSSSTSVVILPLTSYNDTSYVEDSNNNNTSNTDISKKRLLKKLKRRKTNSTN